MHVHGEWKLVKGKCGVGFARSLGAIHVERAGLEVMQVNGEWSLVNGAHACRISHSPMTIHQ